MTRQSARLNPHPHPQHRMVILVDMPAELRDKDVVFSPLWLKALDVLAKNKP